MNRQLISLAISIYSIRFIIEPSMDFFLFVYIIGLPVSFVYIDICCRLFFEQQVED